VSTQHAILNSPLTVPSENGRIKVMKLIAENQAGMGEALTLDSIKNSVDAESIAHGPSGKGPGRGAIVRHGRYVLWSFEGPVSDMTDAGRKLFVNTVFYTARQQEAQVLEKRKNGTRDSLIGKIVFARKNPGYLNTIKRLYVPEELGDATLEQVEKWVMENRPYLHVDGKRFVVDEFAKSLGIPNHQKRLLEQCIKNLGHAGDDNESLKTLVRYTGLSDLGSSPEAWVKWYQENKAYLFFSDCERFMFKLDLCAKEKGIPSEKLRGWSSEMIDYRL